MGNTSKRYSAEVQERAVRLFQEQEHVHEYPTRWAAMQSIAGKIGCTAETMRSWAAFAGVGSPTSPEDKSPFNVATGTGPHS